MGLWLAVEAALSVLGLLCILVHYSAFVVWRDSMVPSGLVPCLPGSHPQGPLSPHVSVIHDHSLTSPPTVP